jgi:hypothetical protein
LTDLAITESGAVWYAGSQVGGLVIGNLFAPDPGTGGLLFRTSATAVVDVLRSYGGGYFLAVDADGAGHPVVAGKFRGSVDLGAGPISVGDPSVVVARLNL